MQNLICHFFRYIRIIIGLVISETPGIHGHNPFFFKRVQKLIFKLKPPVIRAYIDSHMPTLYQIFFFKYTEPVPAQKYLGIHENRRNPVDMNFFMGWADRNLYAVSLFEILFYFGTGVIFLGQTEN